HRRLARGGLDREERVRREPERLVQHAQRGVPGGRPPRRPPGHRLLRAPAAGARAARVRPPAPGARRAPRDPRRPRAGGRPCPRRRRRVLRRRARVRAAPGRGPRLAPMARIVVSGYVVRNPIGGYAWQAAHYLLGLRALGHDVWFHEDTGLYPHAYNPTTNEFGPSYDYGIGATGAFLSRLG